MTPDKLKSAGWFVVEGTNGSWAATREGNPLVVYRLLDGSVVYALPEEVPPPSPVVVKGFLAHESKRTWGHR